MPGTHSRRINEKTNKKKNRSLQGARCTKYAMLVQRSHPDRGTVHSGQHSQPLAANTNQMPVFQHAHPTEDGHWTGFCRTRRCTHGLVSGEPPNIACTRL